MLGTLLLPEQGRGGEQQVAGVTGTRAALRCDVPELGSVRQGSSHRAVINSGLTGRAADLRHAV